MYVVRTSIRVEEAALDAELALTAVRIEAELGQRRERLRPVVAVLGDDVATSTQRPETRYLLLLLQQHHADRCPTVLPRDAMLARNMLWPCVRLSVCVSNG